MYTLDFLLVCACVRVGQGRLRVVGWLVGWWQGRGAKVYSKNDQILWEQVDKFEFWENFFWWMTFSGTLKKSDFFPHYGSANVILFTICLPVILGAGRLRPNYFGVPQSVAKRSQKLFHGKVEGQDAFPARQRERKWRRRSICNIHSRHLDPVARSGCNEWVTVRQKGHLAKNSHL